MIQLPLVLQGKRTPRSALLAGRRKVDDRIEPSALRGPVIVLGSVLRNDQEPPEFHELPLPVELEPSETAVPLATARFFVSVLEERLKLNPVPGLSHAVLRSILCRPGLLLSMNPPTALSHASCCCARCGRPPRRCRRA